MNELARSDRGDIAQIIMFNLRCPQGHRVYKKNPCKGFRGYGGGKRIDPWYSAGSLYSSLTVTAGRDVCPTSRAVTIRIVLSVHFSLHATPSSSDYIRV